MVVTALGLGLATGFAKSFLGLKGLGLASVVLGSSKAASVITSVGIAGKAIGTLGTTAGSIGLVSSFCSGASTIAFQEPHLLLGSSAGSFLMANPYHKVHPSSVHPYTGSLSKSVESKTHSKDSKDRRIPVRNGVRNPQALELSATSTQHASFSGLASSHKDKAISNFDKQIQQKIKQKKESAKDIANSSGLNYLPPTPFLGRTYPLGLYEPDQKVYHKETQYTDTAGLNFPISFSEVDPSLDPLLEHGWGHYDSPRDPCLLVKPLACLGTSDFKVTDLTRENANSAQNDLLKLPFYRALLGARQVFPYLAGYAETIDGEPFNLNLLKINQEGVQGGSYELIRKNLLKSIEEIDKLKKQIEDIKANPRLKEHFQRYFSSYTYKVYLIGENNRPFFLHHKIMSADKYIPLLNQAESVLKKDLRKFKPEDSQKSKFISELKKPGEKLKNLAMQYANDFLDHLYQKYNMVLNKHEKEEIRQRVFRFWLTYFNVRTFRFLNFDDGFYLRQAMALGFQNALIKVFPKINLEKGSEFTGDTAAHIDRIIRDLVKNEPLKYKGSLDNLFAQERRAYEDFIKDKGVSDKLKSKIMSESNNNSASKDDVYSDLENKFFEYFGSKEMTDQVMMDLRKTFNDYYELYSDQSGIIAELDRAGEGGMQIFEDVERFKIELMQEYANNLNRF